MLSSCGGPAEAPAKPDPTQQPRYQTMVGQVAMLAAEADELMKQKKRDEAAALISKGQPMIAELLAAPRPSVEAMQAVSDLDDLYGQMLVGNRHYGEARMLFQKNVARWKNWKPVSEDTARRLKQAEERVAECDKNIGK